MNGFDPTALSASTIPGARGRTPESCAFRDHHAALRLPSMVVEGTPMLRDHPVP